MGFCGEFRGESGVIGPAGGSFSVFRGLNAISLDAKGRMAIPARYRQGLEERCAGQLVLTIDTEEPCLLLYPMDVWLPIEEKLQAMPNTHPATRRMQRLLLGHASELEMDRNGRILIPPLLREHAHLDKRCTLLGQGRKFELWDEARWQARRDVYLEEVQGTELPVELQSLAL